MSDKIANIRAMAHQLASCPMHEPDFMDEPITYIVQALRDIADELDTLHRQTLIGPVIGTPTR